MNLTPAAPVKAAKTSTSVLQPENNVRTEVRSTEVRSTEVRSDVRSETGNDARSEGRKEMRSDLRNAVRNGANPAYKPSGFGLPCANCRLYFPASLDTCPACNSNERVSPIVARAIPVPQLPAELEPDAELLEQQREAFLREFKSQLFAADADVIHAPVVCTLEEHHEEAAEPASICKPCYDRLQERVDVFEAALHIDLKEAAQIVYDAVWADPSDPSKTYTNAAGALLTELRKRSGVSSLLGPFHPLGN